MLGDLVFILIASLVIGTILTLVSEHLSNRQEKKFVAEIRKPAGSHQRAIRKIKYLRKTYPEAFTPWKYRKFSSNKQQNLRYIRKRR